MTSSRWADPLVPRHKSLSLSLYKWERERERKLLTKIRDDGGNVLYDKDPLTKEVNVLWVQTQEMRNHVALCKPRTFECDTTFGTQSQGYKLHVQCYHSNHTDMWEVAGHPAVGHFKYRQFWLKEISLIGWMGGTEINKRGKYWVNGGDIFINRNRIFENKLI